MSFFDVDGNMVVYPRRKIMKRVALMMVLTVLAISASGISVVAQQGNPQVIKRTEKMRQKVAKIGTGDEAKVRVLLFDGTKISGFISEANQNTFAVMDSSKKATTANYSDVKTLDYTGKSDMSTKSKYIWAGVAGGIGAAIAIFAYAVLHRD